MTDITFLLEAVAVTTATVLPIIVLVRLIGGDPDRVERPRSNPEPEPPRWRVAPAT